MERKTYLSIVATAFVLAGCTHFGHTPEQRHKNIYTPGHKQGVMSEPAAILQPFQFTGRAWFDTDRAVLRPGGKQELDRLVVQLMKAKTRGLVSEKNKVVILGHTDSRASRSYNQRLSERRAIAVAKYLKSRGIPSTAMLAVGKGEMQPVASNRTGSGRQQNRRVEIHIEGDAIRVVSD